MSNEAEFLDALNRVLGDGSDDTIVVDPGSSLDFGNQTFTVPDGLTIDLNGSIVRGLRLLVIGGSLVITDGIWISTTQGPSDGPGIGVTQGSSLTIQNATVQADGGRCSAGIGGFRGGADCDGAIFLPGSVTISDSVVTARGGNLAAIQGGGGIEGSGAGIGAYIGSGGSVLIEGASEVSAQGGVYAAGIGAGQYTGNTETAGVVTITGGTVSATGGLYGAGIGGGEGVRGGIIEILGGSVTANGGDFASGIGGGLYGGAGNILISGGTVTAEAGRSNAFQGAAAGIGSGAGRLGEETGRVILRGGSISAQGSDATTGIGDFALAAPPQTAVQVDGAVSVTTSAIRASSTIESTGQLTITGDIDTTLEGPVSNAGQIDVEFGSNLVLPDGETLTNTGRIDGSGRILGAGTIVNDGSICAPFNNIALSPATPPTGLTVTGTNVYYLPFRDPAGFLISNAVYAPSFDAGCRGVYDASTDDHVHVGWTAGVGGTFVGNATLLAEVPEITTAVQTILEPVLVDPVLTIEPAETTSVAGDTVTVTVSGPRALSNELSSDLTSDAVLSGAGVIPGTTPGTFTSTTLGAVTVTATVEQFSLSRERTMTGTFAHTTAAAPIADLTITASATSISQGGTIELTVEGTDAFGNAVTIDPADVTVTSSVPTDIIDGLRVTFPTASPHVLTVTVGDVSAQVTVEVLPALAATGATDPTPIGMLALLLVMLGLFGVVTPRWVAGRTL